MSLFLIDVAYIGIKSICNIGYYAFKYSYNGIAYLAGSEYMVDKQVIDTNELVLQELKDLRKDISILKANNIKKEVFIEDLVDTDNTIEVPSNPILDYKDEEI